MEIGNNAFRNCPKLTTVTIPNSVKTIGGSAFMACTELTTLNIGLSVSLISTYAFASCEKLENVYIYAEKVPNTLADAFNDSYPDYITLHVPAVSEDAYKAALPWSTFKEIVPLAVVATHKLTYKVDDEVYKTYDIFEGAAITPEPEPKKDGFIFSGWSTIPATMPAEDVIVTGSFTPQENSVVITIGSIGKTTYCSEYDLDFSNVANVKAYTATGYDDHTKTIWLTRVMNVPAGTGILVKGDEGPHPIPVTNVRSVYANFFVGNTGDPITIEETDGDMKNYYLSGKDGSFVSVTGNANIKTNKAYLQLPLSVFVFTRSINVSFDDEDGTTSIKEVKSGEVGDEWFTLQGQRVAKPGKGLYIHNGKKVVIK